MPTARSSPATIRSPPACTTSLCTTSLEWADRRRCSSACRMLGRRKWLRRQYPSLRVSLCWELGSPESQRLGVEDRVNDCAGRMPPIGGIFLPRDVCLIQRRGRLTGCGAHIDALVCADLLSQRDGELRAARAREMRHCRKRRIRQEYWSIEHC